MIVPHRVAAESGDVLRQATINDWTGVGSRCNIAVSPRENPGRRIIPKILYGRIVVESQAIDQFFTAEFCCVGVADICVIASEMVRLSFISHLKKAADMICPCSRKEERHILRNLKIAVLGRGRRGISCSK